MPKPNIPRFKKKPSGNRNLAKDVKTLVRAATYVPRQLLKAISGKGKMQPPTPSGVKPKATQAKATQPKATQAKTETQTKPQGRAEKMNANAAGNRPKAETKPKGKRQGRSQTRQKNLERQRQKANPTQDKIKEQIASLKSKLKNASPRNKIALQNKIDTLTAKLK